MFLSWDILVENATPVSILVTFIVIYLIWFVLDLVHTRNMPPGPWFGWPIVGHLYMLQDDRLEEEMKLAKKYGPVFTLQLGSRRTVFATGEEAVREALITKSKEFAGRPSFPTIDVQLHGVGLGFSDDGPSLRLHKKISMSALHDFMTDKETLQKRIDMEKAIMKKYLLENSGKLIDPDYILTLAVSNIICQVTLGKRFDGSEPQYLKMMKYIRIFLIDKELNNALVNSLPWLQYFPNKMLEFAKEVGEGIASPIRIFLKDHKKSFDPNNIRDLIDGLLKAKQDAIAKHKDNVRDLLSDTHMTSTIRDLTIGGFETTTATLLWAIIYFANNPEIQQAVQEELDKVIGTNRTPTLNDKPHLPLLQATTMEIQRMSNIHPEAIFHKATQDTTLCGFHIPKETMVLVNLYSVHMDEKVYSEPHKFNPWRFMDSEGNVVSVEHNYIPFGAGRRVCPGEALAKVELFLFLSDIMQNFNIKRKDEELISNEAIYGIIRAPKPFEVIFEPRNRQETP